MSIQSARTAITSVIDCLTADAPEKHGGCITTLKNALKELDIRAFPDKPREGPLGDRWLPE